MPIKVNHRLSKESFLFACKICEQDDPSITYNTAQLFSHRINRLILLNAFKVGSLKYLTNDHGYYHELSYKGNKPGYIDHDNQFIEVSELDIKNYNLDLRWIVKTIANDIQTSNGSLIEEIIPDILWQIGFVNLNRKIPVFFARRIKQEEIYLQIKDVLNKRKSSTDGIILTSCDDLPKYCNSRIAGHKIIFLQDCLIHNHKNFHIDEDILKTSFFGKITKQKDGFSNGYRTALFDGVEYEFTKKQAAIIEALDKHCIPMNKSELLVEADSEQDDVYRIFRIKNKKHPAWGVLIKNDGKGNYWLE